MEKGSARRKGQDTEHTESPFPESSGAEIFTRNGCTVPSLRRTNAEKLYMEGASYSKYPLVAFALLAFHEGRPRTVRWP